MGRQACLSGSLPAGTGQPPTRLAGPGPATGRSTRVVIVGGGFAGLACARRLAKGDYLVLAAGAQANFFKTPDVREHALLLYSREGAAVTINYHRNQAAAEKTLNEVAAIGARGASDRRMLAAWPVAGLT